MRPTSPAPGSDEVAGRSCGPVDFAGQAEQHGAVVDPLLAVSHEFLAEGGPNDGLVPVASVEWGGSSGRFRRTPGTRSGSWRIRVPEGRSTLSPSTPTGRRDCTRRGCEVGIAGAMRARSRRFRGYFPLAAGLTLASCSALTDFSPIERDAAMPPDTAPPDDAGAADEAGMFCHDGSNPCPPGTVLVPCGPVVLGSDPGEGDTDEEPEHTVDVSAFCIDVAEVTNAAYKACVDRGDCEPPAATGSATRSSYYGNPTYDSFAMVNVTWFQADNYCRKSGKRLPTEAEWEKAARGGCEVHAPTTCGPEDELVYPWGSDEPSCEQANFVGCVGDVDRVQSRPAGASPYGVQDMTGNVQEWVSDWYLASAYETCMAGGCIDPVGPAMGSDKVLRGGHWESVAAYLRVANRFRQPPGFYAWHTGFRCVAPIR